MPRKKSKNLLEKAVFDQNYRQLRLYFKNGKKFLSRKGALLLGTASLASIGEIKRLAKKEHYAIKLLSKSSREFIEGDTPIDLRIYELKPKIA